MECGVPGGKLKLEKEAGVQYEKWVKRALWGDPLVNVRVGAVQRALDVARVAPAGVVDSRDTAGSVEDVPPLGYTVPVSTREGSESVRARYGSAGGRAHSQRAVCIG